MKTAKSVLSKTAIMMSILLLPGCSSTVIWQLNDSIPSQKERPERIRFDERLSTFLGFYVSKDRAAEYYIINDDKLIIDTPLCFSNDWENKLPMVICNPRGDMNKCSIIID
ncbi:hypothetical protein [Vibrio splendidus]|uniref:hypothetical protein n=1 Tax=Vibrio splendidus TaxID=29497 RepID=UPI000C82F70E|nr:hypothetical protein [Vibrio splendidus]PMG18456.1 hypothetical protein BCU95_23615 [Vibrio splendidus]